MIFSCNTNHGLTLESQPYLLESLSNYLVFCVENIESVNFEDPIAKKNQLVSVNVPSYIDSKYHHGGESIKDSSEFHGKLDYR